MGSFLSHRTLWFCAMTWSLSACAVSIEPDEQALQTVRQAAPSALDHALWGSVLERFVDEQGLLDYRALLDDRSDFDVLYAQVASTSPDSHPELYPSESDRLAYWLDAYNIAVVQNVLTHYPLESVLDVDGPLLLPGFLSEEGAGFFYFRELVFGGKDLDLYTVENDIVRARFGDPRIHFALNCASLGCPRLPRRPFAPDALDARLQRATVEFFAEPRNLRFEPVTNTVTLSAILDWYRDDFVRWLEREAPQSEPTLIEYAARHATSSVADALRAAEDPTVAFETYDWRLNDRDGSTRADPRSTDARGTSPQGSDSAARR